ncbi:MAG: hypothetical protein IKF50_05585 [Clostridia bacterium]|nr:hypothetical protein [Clostridia bacterium]
MYTRQNWKADKDDIIETENEQRKTDKTDILKKEKETGRDKRPGKKT